jgi:hypothetical protein
MSLLCCVNLDSRYELLPLFDLATDALGAFTLSSNVSAGLCQRGGIAISGTASLASSHDGVGTMCCEFALLLSATSAPKPDVCGILIC